MRRFTSLNAYAMVMKNKINRVLISVFLMEPVERRTE